MLRTTRTTLALLRQLALGTAAFTTVVAAGTILLGCEDENEPETWVKRLDNPATRAGAIKRLTQFYEDGMTKANDDRDKPEIKALLAKIVKPMADQYVKGDLDEKTRVELLKALANTRDPQAKDAIIKAISDFAAGKDTADEMTQAANYVKSLKLKEAAGPLLDAFQKITPSDPKLGPPYIATKDAMLSIPDPSWKPKLLENINRPINTKDTKSANNEIYWQTVSAELLGDLKADDAVKPLFKIILDPSKANVAATAVTALVKIGKPVENPVLDILSGKDTETNDYAKKVGGDQGKTAAVTTSAIVLGTIGRSEAVAPLVVALNNATDDGTRAVIGREMAKLPATPDAIKTLESVYEKIAPSALIPPGDPARIVIAESAGQFMDPTVLPWLLKMVVSAGKEKAEKDDIDAMQSALLQTAMKLMKKDQMDDVKKLIDVEGSPIDKESFKRAGDVLTACGDNVGCYLAKLDDPKVQEKNEQFTGIKSAYMLGMLGNAATKDEIVKKFPKVKNAAIKFVATLAIDHLSPQGDAKIADELQKLIDADVARGDQNALQGDAPIKQVIPRLRARAAS